MLLASLHLLTKEHLVLSNVCEAVGNIADYIINETRCRHLLLGQKSLWLLELSLAYYLRTSPTFGMGSQLFSPSDWTHSRIKPHTHGQHIGRYKLHMILIIGEFV